MAKAKDVKERSIPASEHPDYLKYGAADLAMLFIESYGQIDGGHHKAWVLDQVARVLKGTPVIIYERSWDNGKTWHILFQTGDPSAEYLSWVRDMIGEPDQDGDTEYTYDEGTAP